MRKQAFNTVFVAKSAVIAALYAVLCVAVSPLSYGAVQCRIAESLCVLTAFTPTAVFGLTAGCLIANVFSFNPIDMLFGTVATLVAAICSRRLRNVKIGGVGWLVPLPAVAINMVVIGLELQVYSPMQGDGFFFSFALAACSVGIGQFIACYLFGIPLYMLIDRTRIKKIISQ